MLSLYFSREHQLSGENHFTHKFSMSYKCQSCPRWNNENLKYWRGGCFETHDLHHVAFSRKKLFLAPDSAALKSIALSYFDGRDLCRGTQAYWDQININQQSLSFSCFYPWVSTTLRSNLFLQFHSSSSTWILILAPPCCKTTPTLKHIMLKIKPVKPSNNLIHTNLRESFKVQSKPTVQCPWLSTLSSQTSQRNLLS